VNTKTELYSYNHLCHRVPSTHPQTFMMHSHNNCEFIFFEKGEANYIIEGRRYRLNKNDLVFIRPLKYHYIEFLQDTEYSRYNVGFNPSLINSKLIDSIPEHLEVINCPPESIIAGLFKRMDYYCPRFDKEAFTEILSALMTELLYNLSIADTSLTTIPSETTPLLTEILDYINANLFTVREVKEISAHFYISEQYLYRLFKTQIRITPLKYINTKRLLYAQNMLHQGKKPTDIYHLCGFDSYTGFYKQYVNTFGYAPSVDTETESL